MSDDIIARLRSERRLAADQIDELIAEILRLRAEVEKLRAALKPFADLEPIVDAYGKTLGVKLAAKDITEG